MSALTQNERDGLDEVFLSINTNRDKYKKIKEISTLILSHQTTLNLSKLLRDTKSRLKDVKLSHFLFNFSKKKKNLSK